MNEKTVPFLWHYIDDIQVSPSSTHGEEHVTKSANEETDSSIISIKFKTKTV